MTVYPSTSREERNSHQSHVLHSGFKERELHGSALQQQNWDSPCKISNYL